MGLPLVRLGDAPRWVGVGQREAGEDNT